MRLSFRTVFWGAVAVLIVLALVVSLRPQPVRVDIGTVSRGPLVQTVNEEGYTRIRDVYAVAAPISGQLLRVDPEAGDAVASGDVIAQLLPAEPQFLDARSRGEAEAAVHMAEAALSAAIADQDSASASRALAQAEYDRQLQLFESDIASQAALDRAAAERRSASAAFGHAQAAVQLRRAELEAAEVRLIGPDSSNGELGVLDIRSPVDGVVLRVMQESAGPVAAGTVLLETGDPAGLEIVVELLSSDAVEVEPGATVEISGWSVTGETLRGRVRRVEPFGFLKVSALGVEEQRVNVIIDFLDHAERWSRLGHGFRIEAAIAIWSADETLRLPVSALFRQDGAWAVYRRVDGRAVLTPVEIGRSNGEMAQLLSGLEAGSEIVLYPGNEVADGVALAVREG